MNLWEKMILYGWKLLTAETIRANRESELQFADNDIIPSFKRNADFVQYFQKLGEGKGAFFHDLESCTKPPESFHRW